MTKEELKQEAEELIQRFEMANSMNCFMQLTPDRKQIGEMIVMVAEPREKRISELEKENTELKSLLEEKHKVDNSKFWKRVWHSIWRNEELEEQLAKAKEIIKKFLLWENDWHKKTESKYELLKQAEQFLKE